MKRLSILLFTFLCSVMVASGQDAAKDHAAITELVKGMTMAQLAYDARALDKILAADYVEVSPVGDVDTREKVLGFYKPTAKPPGNVTVAGNVDEFSIRNYGKFAVVVARLTYTTTVDGKGAPPRSMRATFVCRREKDAWKISSAQYTGIKAS